MDRIVVASENGGPRVANPDWDDVFSPMEEFSDDHFEDDSICSWTSEPESVVNNWRGWKKATIKSDLDTSLSNPKFTMLSLTEASAREVASSIPFEMVEKYYPPVPEQLQLRIAFWSFPDMEEDIRLYSCLANGSADEFIKGEYLLKAKAVKDPLQIGFHLSATIVPGSGKQSQSTSVTFDRRKIVSCTCSCNSVAEWCSHIVALCLYRIHQARSVRLRAPVSESLSHLERNQLQKFAQYLIAELPQQILPTAQRLLDELLSSTPTAINTVCGAPDPTAGGSTGEQSQFCLDEKNLRDNIKKILIKFCVPAPIVFSDVNYLSSTATPSAAEWCGFLRPLRGREPEGMWNLLSIVREMFKRNDRNSIPLLEIITLQCLETVQIIVWWFNTKVAFQQKSPAKSNVNSNSQASQNACASLCDEIVYLWKLASLNPCISPQERSLLKQRLISYHRTVIDKIQANQSSHSNSSRSTVGHGSTRSKANDLEFFSGFKSAIEGCNIDWCDYPIIGVTYGCNSHYLSPFAIFKQPGDVVKTSQVNSSQAVLCCQYPTVSRSRIEEEEEEEEEFLNESDEGVVTTGTGTEVPPPPVLESDENEYSDWSSSAVDSDNKGIGVPIVEAPHSDDQYRVYFYNGSEPRSTSQSNDVLNEKENSEEESIDIFRNLRSTLEDPWEILFMRAEGIHAHGYHAYARSMAVDLAHHMLQNPLDLMTEYLSGGQVIIGKKKRISSGSHQVTQMASTLLSHCAFLCTVLSENDAFKSLAFQIGLFGVEMARPPASSKPMEVKLAHQESELFALLKKINLGPNELQFIRDRASLLKEGRHTSKGDAIMPFMLASFIFESLVFSNPCRSTGDELLGFEAAVSSLGLKVNVSEAEHPLLCEGSRRQKGDLLLLLLVHYKDNPERIAKIMDKYLDKDIHPVFKSLIAPSFYDIHHGTRSEASVVYSGENNNFSTSNNSSYTNSNTATCATNPRGDSFEEESQSSFRKRVGPGSDSGSSGNSSADSIDTRVPTMTEMMFDLRLRESSKGNRSLVAHRGGGSMGSGNIRFKGKRAYPSIPNQPSESSAHFMIELAKTLLAKAGGSSSTSLFTQPSTNPTPRGPQWSLHMCSFQIGLYALGLHNSVTPNWLSRTYSSHVSWITGQALELGSKAIHFLVNTWEGHLTPPEAASIADRSSRGNEPQMVHAAADLALSVLPHAASLNQNEIQQAIQQCKEQSSLMLEKACHAVEAAATGGGVYPEVLFEVARHWHDLWKISLPARPNEQFTHPPIQFPYPMYSFISGFPAMYALPPHPGELLQKQQQTAVVAAAAAGFQVFQPNVPPRFAPSLIQLAPLPPNLLTPPAAAQPLDANSQRLLMSAYRIGMLALESMGRKISEERPHVKFSKNPIHGEDVKRLLSIAQRLGLTYLQKFLIIVGATVISPFLLQDLTWECAIFLTIANSGVFGGGGGGPPPFMGGNTTIIQTIRSNPQLTQLTNKCCHTYYKVLLQKLCLVTYNDYDEYVVTIRHARNAFHWTPEGPPLFQTLIQSIRKSKACKKELWQKIVTSVQTLELPPM